MSEEKKTDVVQLSQIEQEVQVLKLKQEAEFSLTPIGQKFKQFEVAKNLAKMYAYSNFIPDSYKYTKSKQPLDPATVIANCTIAVDMAIRMKADPLMIMQNLYIVYGQPAFSSKFLIATINASKRFSPLRYEFRGEEGTESYACRVVAYEINDVKHKEPLTGDWISIGMAKKEGWFNKNGSKWNSMPSQMLRYRAAAFWQRTYCPEISMGLLTAEEVKDEYVSYEELSSVPNANHSQQIPTDSLGRPSLTAAAALAAKQNIQNDNANQAAQEAEAKEVGNDEAAEASNEADEATSNENSLL